MKKFFAFLLSVLLVISFASCGNKSDVTGDNNSTVNNSGFKSPEGYVAVVSLSINPKFNIYVDADNKVLAVEPLNKDAEAVKDKLLNNETELIAVVKNIITVVNDAGFIKQNTEVKLTLTEVKNQTYNTEALLNNVKSAVDAQAGELKLTVTVAVDNQVPEDESNNETETPGTDTTFKPQVSKSVYSFYMTSTFNQDGSINFDVIAADCIQFFEDEKYLVNSEDGIIFDYEYPEKVIYDRIVKKYVFSDADWKAFKAKGSYSLNGPETATYENGKFKYRRIDGWGGGEPVTYTILETSDDKKGKLEIYYEVTPAESTPYKVRVRYQYDKKYANTKYEIIKPNNQYYFGAISSENKDFINSIKVAKVIESPINNVTYEHDGISIMFYLYNSRPSYITCYGFSGGTPEFACGCNFNGETNPSWNFNSQTKEARCPCGSSVLKNPFIDIVHW